MFPFSPFFLVIHDSELFLFIDTVLININQENCMILAYFKTHVDIFCTQENIELLLVILMLHSRDELHYYNRSHGVRSMEVELLHLV